MVSSAIMILVPGLATRSISLMAFCLSLKKLMPPTWNTTSNILSAKGKSSALQCTKSKPAAFFRHTLRQRANMPSDRSAPVKSSAAGSMLAGRWFKSVPVPMET